MPGKGFEKSRKGVSAESEARRKAGATAAGARIREAGEARAILALNGGPLTILEIQTSCGLSAARGWHVVARLVASGRIRKLEEKKIGTGKRRAAAFELVPDREDNAPRMVRIERHPLDAWLFGPCSAVVAQVLGRVHKMGDDDDEEAVCA